jgi:Transposase
MNDRIVGLDVSKDNVTVCLLTDSPPEPRQIYLENDFLRLYANADGMRRLLALNPTVAVLEPTGVNYSKVWVTRLAEAGVTIALVGHKELRTYRKTLDLPDKDDEADALALACYYLQFRRSPHRFVRLRDDLVSQMRDLVLRYQYLNRLQSPLVNRLKQDLAWAFPERAKTTLDGYVFWGWLAGAKKSKKYDRELTMTCGLGLSEHIRHSAKMLQTVTDRQLIVERDLRICLEDERFLPYREAFDLYGFGEKLEAIIISQVFPLDNYLVDGKAHVLNTRSRTNPEKKTRKHISERKFLKALGMAPQREWSGDSKKSYLSGSQLCRTALWQWIFTRLEVKKGRLNNPRFLILSSEFDRLKETSTPIKLVRSKVAAKAVKMLFYDLLKAVHPIE